MSTLNEKQIKKLLEMQKAMEGGAVQPNELEQVVTVILNIIKELRIQLISQISDTQNSAQMSSKEIKKLLRGVEAEIKEAANLSELKSLAQIKDVSKKLYSEISKVIGMIPTMPDIDAVERKIEAVERKIPVIKDTILDTPEEIREKVQSLPEDERWVIEDVKDLREELDKLKREIAKKQRAPLFGGFTGGSTGGKIVKSYDLSASLNGVLKTFSLPAFWRVISVHSSSTPNVLRPTTDYTTSGSTITFTSEIDAATTLATGQTLLIVYAEA